MVLLCVSIVCRVCDLIPFCDSEMARPAYEVKQAPRDTLQEDLTIIREQVLPRIEQLERENEALKQQTSEQQPQQPAAQSAGYDVKSAPRELLEEDLLIARSHLLPRIEQLAAENEALRQQQQGQQQQGQGE